MLHILYTSLIGINCNTVHGYNMTSYNNNNINIIMINHITVCDNKALHEVVFLRRSIARCVDFSVATPKS